MSSKYLLSLKHNNTKLHSFNRKATKGRFRPSANTSSSSQLCNRYTHIERESPSELVLEEPSSTTFAAHLELYRTSLESIILGKINLQFISNCLDRQQTHRGSLCFGKKHNAKAYLKAVVVEPSGHNKPLERA